MSRAEKLHVVRPHVDSARLLLPAALRVLVSEAHHLALLPCGDGEEGGAGGGQTESLITDARVRDCEGAALSI